MRSVILFSGLLALASLDTACVKDDAVPREIPRAAPEPAPPVPSAAAISASPAWPAVRVVGYPNGAALAIRPNECRLTRIGRNPDDRWDLRLGACGSVLTATIAPNSVAVVRTATELVAVAPDGKRTWSAPASRVAPELAEPAALLDSVVVAAASSSTIVAYRPDGTVAWTFRLEGEERFVAAPRRSETEGAIAISNAAVYAIGPDGTVRWRNTLEPPPK